MISPRSHREPPHVSKADPIMTFLVFVMLALLAVFSLRGPLRRTRLARLTPTQQSLAALFLALLLILLFTGRLGFMIPLLAAVLAAVVATLTRILPVLLPIITQSLPHALERWRQGRVEPWSRTQAHASSKGSTTVESAFLRMHLDTTKGTLTGEVIQGEHAGISLAQLHIDDLRALYERYQERDETSAQLLRAYIERHFGPQWEDLCQKKRNRPQDLMMTRGDALEILGLPPQADREAIITAHRRLIQKLHPDRGGSDYLAAKINQAKDFLLG